MDRIHRMLTDKVTVVYDQDSVLFYLDPYAFKYCNALAVHTLFAFPPSSRRS